MPELLLLSQLETPGKGGSLMVLDERHLPFAPVRSFVIQGASLAGTRRGGHRHVYTRQAALCLTGSFTMRIKSGDGAPVQDFRLDAPNKCLIIEPEDWNELHDFSPDATVLVMASHSYDPADYIHTPYAE